MAVVAYNQYSKAIQRLKMHLQLKILKKFLMGPHYYLVYSFNFYEVQIWILSKTWSR